MPQRWQSLLNGLSLPTMPEGLLDRMLTRAGVTGPQQAALLERYQTRRTQLRERLDHGVVDELLLLPDRESVLRGNVQLNLGAELIEFSLFYTLEEYAEHISAIRELVRTEKNYHLTLLPQPPFRDLQIFLLRDAAAVLRFHAPQTAFIFTNHLLTRSMEDYFKTLTLQFAADRRTTIQALEKILSQNE